MSISTWDNRLGTEGFARDARSCERKGELQSLHFVVCRLLTQCSSDQETLDIPESGTFSQLSAAHRDLVPGPSSPSALHDMFGNPPYPFPGS